MQILTAILSIVYVLVCLLLILIVLIQKGESGGLGGAFGGGGVDGAFGSGANTAWKKATSVVAALFLILSMAIGVLEMPSKDSSHSELNKGLQSQNQKALKTDSKSSDKTKAESPKNKLETLPETGTPKDSKALEKPEGSKQSEQPKDS